MIVAALLLALFAVYLLQYRLYAKHSFDGIHYDVTLDASEVVEGEDVFLTEEIVNTGRLPLPFVKVDTALPTGLRFRLIDKEEDGTRTGRFSDSIQSVFVLRPNEKIRRTWRVNCHVRGEYSVGEVMLVTNDLIGFNQQARHIKLRTTSKNMLVVLPRTLDLLKTFPASRYLSGELPLRQGVVTDPLRIAGIRDYTDRDPMNRIHWKSSAAHGSLMVRLEEYTRRHQFNLVLNMNSRDIERVPGPPSIPSFTESCITVVASILESVADENVEVRLIANTMPPETDESFSAARTPSDAVGREIFLSPAMSGKRDMIAALRLLASLPLHIGISIEKMLDHIVAYPEMYTSGGNLVFVSHYLSERMLIFAEALRARGVHIVFFITGTSGNASVIPENVEVYFRTDIR